ncbi:MAG: toprim domain-containing protein [Pseudomonadota bacterium]
MYVALRPTQETIAIVSALRGKWHGSYALCRCPAHEDCKPSLSIRQGHKGLLVHCFAGCSPEEVLREIARLPTNGAPTVPTSSAYSAQSRGDPRRLWESGVPVPGTLAAQYLTSRHLPIDLPDIRFHPRCPLGPKPRTRFFPALLVALRQRRELTAVQRIFLHPETAQSTSKMLLGTPHGAAWRASGPVSQLALAEGFEDAAAFTKITGIPCWAALGGERMPQIQLPDDLHHLILAPDHDRAGRLAVRKANEAYCRPGLHIETRFPRPFKDWAAMNEQLCERT